jgi:hypothetical protein
MARHAEAAGPFAQGPVILRHPIGGGGIGPCFLGEGALEHLPPRQRQLLASDDGPRSDVAHKAQAPASTP